MAGVVAFVEHKDGRVRRSSLETVSEARRLADGGLGGPVVAVAVGTGAGAVAVEAGAYGADRVHVLEDAALQAYATEAFSRAVVAVVQKEQPKAVLAAFTSVGRDLMPRVAATLGAGPLPGDVARALGDLLEHGEVARVPRLGDHVELPAHLTQHGVVHVLEVHEAQVVLREQGGDEPVVLEQVDRRALAAVGTVERPDGLVTDVFEDDAGHVRAVFVTNPGAKAARATLRVAAGASLRDALDDQPVRLDGATAALDAPARGVRWLTASW